MGLINSITRYLCTNLNGIWIRQRISCTAFLKKIMLSAYTENMESQNNSFWKGPLYVTLSYPPSQSSTN